MQKDEVQKSLDAFRDHIIRQARSNLTRLKKNSSKKLYNSINGKVKAMPNSISMEFTMEEYGFYQDKGVSGTDKKYDSPFSYKSGIKNRPSPRHFDKWVVRKGLAPRTASGQFANRSGIKFALAYHIQKYGIKPSLFFTKPFEAAYKKLPNELIEKYGIEAAKLFMENIVQPKK